MCNIKILSWNYENKNFPSICKVFGLQRFSQDNGNLNNMNKIIQEKNWNLMAFKQECEAIKSFDQNFASNGILLTYRKLVGNF